jgi:hypothetical protein
MEGLNLFIEHIPSVSPNVIIIKIEEIDVHCFHNLNFIKFSFCFVRQTYVKKSVITKNKLVMIILCEFICSFYIVVYELFKFIFPH